MQLSPDPSNHFELLRILGHAYYGGADVQEVLQVASAITPGDDEGWFHHWNALAEQVRSAGYLSLEKGRIKSASQSFLRASMYFMISDFYLHANVKDPRIVRSSRASRECFMAAVPGMDYQVTRVDIPYEGDTLPGYVVKKKGTPVGPRPTIICHSGFDGTKEEIALWPGMAAAERGYTVIVFEGPGQGEVIRESGRTFRPDWENVVTPVIDFALNRDDVDPARIALMGISLGGVLAPIAAAKDHRLKALIANGGLYSFYEVLCGRFDAESLGDRVKFNEIASEICTTNTTVRWATNHGKFVFGAADAFDYLAATVPFEAKDAAKIRCQTLVIDSEQEGFFEGQPKKLFDKLTCQKTLLHFPTSEAVGAHCQAGAEAAGGQKIFDWLDNVLEVDGAASSAIRPREAGELTDVR